MSQKLTGADGLNYFVPYLPLMPIPPYTIESSLNTNTSISQETLDKFEKHLMPYPLTLIKSIDAETFYKVLLAIPEMGFDEFVSDLRGRQAEEILRRGLNTKREEQGLLFLKKFWEE